MKMLEYPFFLVVSLLIGCASSKPSSSGSGSASGKYSEDLSVWRPKVEAPRDTIISSGTGSNDPKKNTATVTPKYAVNAKLDAVLDSINQQNLAKKFVEGFTIQVYSGRREEALNIRKQLMSVLPDISSEVQFTEPIFRVKAGKYFSWIDAQRDFTEIKKTFPAAIIIPDKIAIN